ncbi:MAG TPA: hypothetical protein VEI08_02395 [Candidatus Bathyarchaeia archaeon]|nr:hypothetical protein [Candidatus Bathyarchaeia archaeon]
MNDKVADLLLRAKHWQIFFLLLGTYVLAVMATTRLSPRLSPRTGHEVAWATLLIGAGIAPYVLSIFGWLWAAGLLFNANVKPELRLRTGFFRFAVVYVVLGFIFGLPIFWASNQIQQRWLVLPQLFGFICIIYILNFAAKAFVTIRRGKRSLPWHYVGYMVQFLALPLFVWQIQPQINRLYAAAQESVT